MFQSTKRPPNKCNDCGDTWYPRGRDLSHKCGNCGSTDISLYENDSYILEGLVGFGVLITGVVVCSGIYHGSVNLVNHIADISVDTASKFQESFSEDDPSSKLTFDNFKQRHPGAHFATTTLVPLGVGFTLFGGLCVYGKRRYNRKLSNLVLRYHSNGGASLMEYPPFGGGHVPPSAL